MLTPRRDQVAGEHGEGGKGLALCWKFPPEVIKKGIACPGRL